MSTYGVRQDDGFAISGRIDSEQVFRRAMRHSRRVRVLRVLLPVCVILVLGGFLLSSWLDPLRLLTRAPLDSGKLVISGTKITMQAPKLSGYTRDARWYELSANSAAQDIADPNVIELLGIHAKIETDDNGTIDLTASDGVFDRKAGLLTLGREIVLKSTTGFEVQLSNAVIDTATGEVVSNKPVEVRMLQGVLTAKGVQVTNAGEIVRFDGGVTMQLPPRSFEAEGPQAKP
jgi:lipopolysaccharide export system protein LptC